MKRKRLHSLNTPEKLAEKFHRRADKSGVLQRFARKARVCSKRQARRYAFHIASWFSCAPADYIPGSIEMDLLHKFVSKLGGGQLPKRLQKALPKALAALDSMDLADRTLDEARQRLRQSLQRFQCCRNSVAEEHLGSGAEGTEAEEAKEEEDVAEQEDRESAEDTDMLPSKNEEESGDARDAEAGCMDTAIVEVDSSEDEEGAVDVSGYNELGHDGPSDVEAGESSVPVPDAEFAELTEVAEPCGKEVPSHLFRRINEWINMVNGEKLACLKQLQLASACS